MGFMSEISEEVGSEYRTQWIIKNLPRFHETLQGAAYDNFPLEELIEWLKNLK